MRLRRLSIVCVFSAVLLAACAPPGPAPSSDGSSGVPQPADKKRIVAGLRGDPPILGSKLYSTVGSSGGPTEIERLMNAGLTIRDDRTELRPILAEAVPTTENGAWQVFPDGRMVTTWKIRTGAAWHDGTPFTSADLVFTAKVVMDGELTEFKDSAFNGIDSVQAPDPRTVVVNWKRPFIYANTIFLLPQPKHLLEETYLQSKDAYRSMSYWTDDYVGAGPFKLREFARGDHVTLVANDAFVLGRPRVDEVEIRFVPNTNSLAAHILAGSIDMTLEQDTMSADTVAQMLTSGWPGRAVQHMDDPIGAWPQFMDPSPRVILEAPFRRALVHALDRQLMADNLEYGLSQVAHTPLWPDDPMFRYAEPRVVKYAYDQRQAIELIQGLGYARDSDAMFRDASGQPLKVELRATPGHELSTKSTLVAADMWQAVGVAVDTVMIPPALNNDAEYRQTRTGFEVAGMKFDLNRFTTSQVPTAENRFTGSNRSRYMNPAMDDLADRFYVTIPEAERGEIAAQAYHLISDQVVMINFFYEAQQGVRANRLVNVTSTSPVGWNAHEWDIATH